MNPFRHWAVVDFEHHAADFRELVRTSYGLDLDYSPGSVGQLDDFVDIHFGPGSADDHSSLIVGMGCYLGEVVVRSHGGHWSADEEFFHSPAVVIAGKLETRTFPLSRVWRRFEYGPEQSLVAYYGDLRRTLARL